MYRVLQTGVPPRSTQSQWTFPPTFTGNWQTLPVLRKWLSGNRRFSMKCFLNMFVKYLFQVFHLDEHRRGTESLTGPSRLPTLGLNKAPSKKPPVFWWTYKLPTFPRYWKAPLGHHPPVKPLFSCNSVVFLKWQESGSYSGGVACIGIWSQTTPCKKMSCSQILLCMPRRKPQDSPPFWHWHKL